MDIRPCSSDLTCGSAAPMTIQRRRRQSPRLRAVGHWRTICSVLLPAGPAAVNVPARRWRRGEYGGALGETSAVRVPQTWHQLANACVPSCGDRRRTPAAAGKAPNFLPWPRAPTALNRPSHTSLWPAGGSRLTDWGTASRRSGVMNTRAITCGSMSGDCPRAGCRTPTITGLVVPTSP